MTIVGIVRFAATVSVGSRDPLPHEERRATMYEPFFQLQQRPFIAGPIASRYFPAAAIEQARQTLMRCVQRAQGTGLLLGPTGTGKTLLSNVLAQQFRASHRVVLLAGARLCTRRALLQNILFELGLPYRDMSEGELRLALTSRLDPVADPTAGLLLIVDEADTLPQRLFEELRMLTNIVRDGLPRVQLILSGAPSLEESFANPKFESFNQRVAARCYLQPLSREETSRFIAWQIEMAGGRTDFVLDHSAIQAAHETTAGIPRLINQVCDYALHAAVAAGQRPVTAKNISLAWSELQLLPSPWSSQLPPSVAAPAVESPSMIEFRSLDDLPPLADSHLAEFDFNASPSLIDHGDEATSSTEEPNQPMVEIAASSPDVAEPLAPAISATDALSPSVAHVHETESPPVESPRAVESPREIESSVVDESPPLEVFEQATSETTIGGGFPREWVDAESLVCLAVVGDDVPWPVIPITEPIDDTGDEAVEPERAVVVTTEPELRIVRDDESDAIVPDKQSAEERGRRFRQLFSRLRRRASA